MNISLYLISELSLKNFIKIRGINDFWVWSREKLSKSLRANAWYNDAQPYGLAGYVDDFVSRFVGYATLRQLRVKNSKQFINLNIGCDKVKFTSTSPIICAPHFAFLILKISNKYD